MSSPTSTSTSTSSLLSPLFHGITDALKLHHTALFFFTSKTVRVRTVQCFLLNGIIFLGSIFLADYIIIPLLHLLLHHPIDSPKTSIEPDLLYHISSFLHTILIWFYHVLWIFPIYAVSFILNAIWYQDIADHAFATQGTSRSSSRPPPVTEVTFQRWVRSMAEEVYRLLLVGAFALQMTLLSAIPYVGSFLLTIHLAWLYALYAFEYKWALQGWTLEYRIEYFEARWPYFTGFGLPAALLTVLFPRFVGSGIYAFTFPIFIILAVIARPVGGPSSRPDPSDPSRPISKGPMFRIPIFTYARRLDTYLLTQFRFRHQQQQQQQQQQQPNQKTQT